MSHVYAEQPGSLAAALQNAGIRHGDTAQVTLQGVGVYRQRGEPTIAFCPAHVQRAKVLEEGMPDEREKDFPVSIEIGDRLSRMILEKAPNRGFFDLSLTVHSNGCIDLDGRVMDAKCVDKDVSVRNQGDYDEYCRLQSTVVAST